MFPTNFDRETAKAPGGQNPQSSGQHDVYQRHEFLSERRASFYSDIGRPSIDPELMMRMLMVGYCYGIRSERRLCEEVKLHLAYRWFCRLDLDDPVRHHSTFSVNFRPLSGE